MRNTPWLTWNIIYLGDPLYRAFPVLTPTPTPSPTPQPACYLSAGSVAFRSKTINVEITNNGSAVVTLSSLSLSWPQEMNGNLLEVQFFHKDVLFSGSLSSPASITSADLISDVNKKSIEPGKTKELVLEFEKKEGFNLSLYFGSIDFGPGCNINFPPSPQPPLVSSKLFRPAEGADDGLPRRELLFGLLERQSGVIEAAIFPLLR